MTLQSQPDTFNRFGSTTSVKLLTKTRDDRIARQLDSLVGKPVRVHYSEHRGVPTSCFGDTPYYVDSVTVVTGP